MILVDSCVVIDVLENDRNWAGWSQMQLENWSARGPRRRGGHASSGLIRLSGPGRLR